MPNGDGSAAHGSPQQSIPLGPWGVPDLHVTQTKQKHSTTLLSGSAERERECKVVPKWMREKKKEGRYNGERDNEFPGYVISG